MQLILYTEVPAFPPPTTLTWSYSCAWSQRSAAPATSLVAHVVALLLYPGICTLIFPQSHRLFAVNCQSSGPDTLRVRLNKPTKSPKN
jgi:hypothetical protein